MKILLPSKALLDLIQNLYLLTHTSFIYISFNNECLYRLMNLIVFGEPLLINTVTIGVVAVNKKAKFNC